jgi:hypothetical protein
MPGGATLLGAARSTRLPGIFLRTQQAIQEGIEKVDAQPSRRQINAANQGASIKIDQAKPRIKLYGFIQQSQA